MINYTQCPVCKKADFRAVLKAKDYTVSGKTFSISHCNPCEHRFTNPVPDEDEIGPYYKSQDYVSHTNTSKGIINSLYQRVRRITLKGKRRLVEGTTQKHSGNLLDVGSGAGAFLATMQKAGWNCLGLEPDPDARKVAKNHFQVETQSTDQFFELAGGTYDAITMWHVLEHVHALDAYMEQLKQLLKPDGRLFIAVPNYPSLDGKVYGPTWAAYDVPRHVHHFSPFSMRKVLELHGLKLLGTKRMPFDSFYVCMLSERNKGGSLIKGVWNGWRSWWVALFNKERCSSLIYIIRK